MNSLLWIAIFVLTAEVSGIFSQDGLANVQFQNFDSLKVDTLKKFFQKSLSPEGTFNRHLLISAGVIPPPMNAATTRESVVEMSTEPPVFQFYDHFRYHVEDILSSDDKMYDAIYKLFSEDAFKNEGIDSSTTGPILSSYTTSKMSSPDGSEGFTNSDWLVNYSPDVDIISLDPDQQMLIKNTQYEIEQSSSSSDFSQIPEELDSNLIETASTVTSEENSFTTEYIKFLTDEQSTSNSESDDKIKEHCATKTVFLVNDLFSDAVAEEYSQFLDENSITISPGTTYDTVVTELTESYSTNSAPSLDTSTASVDEFSFSSSEDSFSTQGSPTREELSSLLNEDFISLQSKNHEDVTQNHEIEFQTTEPESNFESSQVEYEPKIDSFREAKEIRQNESEGESSSSINTIRGTPGINYPNYKDIPDKEFNCEDKKHIPGFYADMETRCQVFHVCWPGRRESFLCPIGTIFNQAILACDYWYNSNCSVSSAYFDVNTAFKEVDSKSGLTGPMINTLIKESKKTSVSPAEIISSSGEISELYEADVHFSETVAKHELSKIWKFLPIKAKVFIQPQLKLEDIIGKAKLKRSKKGLDEIDNTDDSLDAASEVRKQSKENIESIFYEVLKNLMSSQEN